MKKIEFDILGIGAWGPGFPSWSELSTMLAGNSRETNLSPEGASSAPKPEIIPANERRRAPLPVKLAVETSWQAIQRANLDAAETPCVFVSGTGDTQLTDYMCKVLAGDNKSLSPTKFHNSVHNAAAGYWTISTGCRKAANSVAGYQESVALAMLEALLQCNTENRPILITFYDAPCSDVLVELLKNQLSFSVSLVIAPAGFKPGNTSTASSAHIAEVDNCSGNEAEFNCNQILERCYATNPAAKILPWLKTIATGTAEPSENIVMPLSAESHINLKVPA